MQIKAKIGKNTKHIRSGKLNKSIRDFVECKKELDLTNEVLKRHKEALIEYAKEMLEDIESSSITFDSESGSVKVVFGSDVIITDEVVLRELLGERFEDLVKIKTELKPEAKLKEMALEDDGLKMCLAVKEKTPSVSVVL